MNKRDLLLAWGKATKRKPEWEVEFDKLLQYDPSEPAEERLKEFIREEMKKMVNDIEMGIATAIDEALKERGVM